MKSVLAFVVVAVLALVGSTVALGCASTPQYRSNLKLACQGNELNFNWPDYKNVSQFYACQGVGRPLLLTCSADTYFSYVLQACQYCDKYIPSQACDTLKTEKGSSCQAMDGATTDPTPIYPTGAPTTTKTTEAPITTPTQSPTTTTTKGPTTTTTTTTTTQKPSNTAFPPAPSPSTVDPNVPIPPTAAPTPPPVDVKPPHVVIPSN